jgi:hypothetical protein
MIREIAGNSLSSSNDLPFVLNFATKARKMQEVPQFYFDQWDYNPKEQVNSSTIPYLTMGNTVTPAPLGTTGSTTDNPYDLDRDALPDDDWR